jgi:hypothetical protein
MTKSMININRMAYLVLQQDYSLHMFQSGGIRRLTAMIIFFSILLTFSLEQTKAFNLQNPVTQSAQLSTKILLDVA